MSVLIHNVCFYIIQTLLKYLASLFSDSSDQQNTDEDDEVSFTTRHKVGDLSNEQISRWCTVLLDAHYTQMILSDQAELLVNLHENISHMVSNAVVTAVTPCTQESMTVTVA